ncbi:type IV toxin-antitoxin system AbiEi family antitoxin domain-containing protein [Phytoactinopolyspora halotolerans]|uniref:Type IV toxin-antitoxin system AbiEi family antitoxin domain-containing protein n=2 Tax=Phytoactinopolyspora halotolerans TaxID=1981512 RepID=A0A6L9SGB6_9ACTN|nr:type IV toxin-antitoxin system AbiEi family antitoxin domain-containing protein [Phytoactinopolyspora halotolerans]
MGLVSRRQLVDHGVGEELARARVRAGRWQRIHRGVYAVFSGPLTRAAQIWAALLRAGDGAVASHQTAAELDGLLSDVDDRIHVTVEATRRVRGKIDGVVVHYAHRLPDTRHPSKDPPRTRIDDTVLDLVDVSHSPRAVAGYVTQACQNRLTTPLHLADALGRRKKIKWRPMLEAMLLDVAEGAQSPLELKYLWSVERAHGLPRGSRQCRRSFTRVIWIDVLYEEFGVVVELDGRVGHDGDGQFRDRRRDNRSTTHGLWTLRYGHAETFGTPCDVAAEVVDLLRRQGWRGTPTPCSPDCPLPTPSPSRSRSRSR